MNKSQPMRVDQGWRRLAASGFLVLIWLICNSPFERVVPTSIGVDQSWELVLSRLAAGHSQWGRDVVFTYGPYIGLYTRQFDPAHPWLLMSLGFVLDALMLMTLMRLTRTVPLRWQGLILILAGFVFGEMPDVRFFMLPLLLGHLCFGLRDDESIKADRSVWRELPLALSAACGLTALIKLSFAPLGVLITLLVDIQRLREGRWPFCFFLFVASYFVFAAVAGQTLATMFAFIYYGMDVIAGYGTAMATHQPNEPLNLLLFSATLLTTLLLIVHAVVLDRRFSARSSLIICLVGYAFILFKAGFVRQDAQHQPAAWAALLFGILLVLARHRDASSAATFSFGLIVAGVALGAVIGLSGRHGRVLERLRDNAMQGPAAVLNPRQWQAQQEVLDKASFDRIRSKATPLLPWVPGSVDIIPSRQQEVIALGMSYRPRPIFQEYSTYTPKLIELNRRFFAGTLAPQFLLWAPGSIDDRWPSQAEGPVWPLILGRYALVNEAGGVLVMRLRSPPCRVEPTLIAELSSPFDGGALAVSGGVFAKIDLNPTWLGRFASLIYKPAAIYLVAQLRDGRTERHSLIPGIVSSGFLLSPYVGTVDELKQFAEGQPDPAAEVVGWRLETSPVGGLEWSVVAATRIYTLDPIADCGDRSTHPAASESSRIKMDRTRNFAENSEMSTVVAKGQPR